MNRSREWISSLNGAPKLDSPANNPLQTRVPETPPSGRRARAKAKITAFSDKYTGG
jgi:hypothetical protein